MSRPSDLVFALAVVLIFAVSSCSRTASQPRFVDPQKTELSEPLVRLDVRYLGAVRLYRSSDIRGALNRIDFLSKLPELSDADRVFLDRQRSICKRALGIIPPAPDPIVKTAKPTQKRGD